MWSARILISLVYVYVGDKLNIYNIRAIKVNFT